MLVREFSILVTNIFYMNFFLQNSKTSTSKVLVSCSDNKIKKPCEVDGPQFKSGPLTFSDKEPNKGKTLRPIYIFWDVWDSENKTHKY